MKVILVPVAGKPECEHALKQAYGLADAFGGSVVGCHLRAGMERSGGVKAQLRILTGKTHADMSNAKQADAVGKAAYKLFSDQAKKHGFEIRKRAKVGDQRSAIWFEISGDLEKLFPIVGPVADLSVLSRPKKRAKGRGDEFMLSALLHSGKPVLLLPQRQIPVVGRRIMIGWDQSSDAARSVSAAMPLLTRAESVVICTCGPENQPGPKSSSLAQYLAMWGVKSKLRKTRGRDVPAELEAACKESKSDLLVMGAYTRSRFAEVWFGGVTEHMLFKSSMSVFASHS